MLNDLIFLRRYNGATWYEKILPELLDKLGYRSLDKNYYYVSFSMNAYYTNDSTIEEDIKEELEAFIPYVYLKETVQSENDLIMFVDTSYPYPRPIKHPVTKEQVFNQNVHFLTFFKTPAEYIMFKLLHSKSNQGIFEFYEL